MTSDVSKGVRCAECGEYSDWHLPGCSQYPPGSTALEEKVAEAIHNKEGDRSLDFAGDERGAYLEVARAALAVVEAERATQAAEVAALVKAGPPLDAMMSDWAREGGYNSELYRKAYTSGWRAALRPFLTEEPR